MLKTVVRRIGAAARHRVIEGNAMRINILY
jgi:hypothetical protein